MVLGKLRKIENSLKYQEARRIMSIGIKIIRKLILSGAGKFLRK